MIRPDISCDIFCRVVDNFGDIGVTWRLARQLGREHGVTVRLIVDDLDSFCTIEPTIDVSRERQEIEGVTLLAWNHSLNMRPAQIVIEAFAVNLPDCYVVAMAEMLSPPVWINLEYLSAETWIGTHHLLPSPHPTQSLVKYFFFPGFTPDTGGLIRERELLAERDAFAGTDTANPLRVFLFGYPNAAVGELIRAISESAISVTCTIPSGALAASVKRIHGDETNLSASCSIKTIPFVPQRAFDSLLWKHDVLFVRGEDSFVRAQWAAKPFIWQIYPQSESTHWAKLNAFLALYCDGLDDATAAALQELWRSWNAEDHVAVGAAWGGFVRYLPQLRTHALAWSKKLAQMPDLAANLLSFYQKTTKI